MRKRTSYAWPTASVILAIVLVVIALPDSAKQWAPGFVRAAGLHYGLDLAGGTQLDFRISEREMSELTIQRRAALQRTFLVYGMAHPTFLRVLERVSAKAGSGTRGERPVRPS